LSDRFFFRGCSFIEMKESEEHKGFTLTELLIWPKGHLRVLLIVGILVAIAIPHYTAFMNKIKELAGW
jgi:Tfp pilus assembly protein PilE